FEGSPAKPIGKKEPYKKATELTFNVKIGYYTTFVVLVFLFPILVLIPLAPSIISLYYLDEQADWYSFYYLFKTPIFAFLYILLFLTEVILLTRIFQKDLQPGNYSIYSKTYLKKWFLDQLFSLSLLVIKPLFATVFISRIYRALGAKVGRNTEISTATNVTHSLLKIGDESFIADDVSIGETEVRNQELQLDFTQIGNRSFVGNSALIPQGYTLGDGMLVGVISLPPSPEQMSINNFKDWFGSPSRPLPNREVISHYPASLTYSPPYFRKIARAIVEFIRVLIPQSAILAFSILFIAYTDDLLKENKWSEIIFYFPFYYLGMVAIPCFLLTWVLKWVFIGRYKIAQHPMWTWDVWKTEAVTSIYESLAIPFFLDYLRGTPFIALFFRSLGVKVGKMTYLDTTDITEFDLVQIGNYTEINLDAGPQTHLFEDRIMKIGSVAVGDFSTIGARSVLLFGTEIGKNCKISALSLVMKGEKIQANTTWEGIPIK
ncbi:MAG: DapH/DapD/GlmU-related protein, partial [Cytophagales bacterium]|nr:DapH/DapD/GlmU-related protein [Cytophagales bacterium]